jgi:hypothetical protein
MSLDFENSEYFYHYFQKLLGFFKLKSSINIIGMKFFGLWSYFFYKLRGGSAWPV